jgi:hypothetical protein
MWQQTVEENHVTRLGLERGELLTLSNMGAARIMIRGVQPFGVIIEEITHAYSGQARPRQQHTFDSILA